MEYSAFPLQPPYLARKSSVRLARFGACTLENFLDELPYSRDADALEQG